MATSAMMATPNVSAFAGKFLAFDNADTWVLIAFLIFVGLLIYVGAFKFLFRALDNRAVEIRRQLDEARQLREEAQRRLAEFERRGQDVQRQAEEVVARAARDAEAAEVEARRSIEASVEQRLRTAQEQIAMAEADAVRAVRNAAVDAAVEAAQDVLKSTLQGDVGRTLTDQAVGDVTRRLS